MEPHRNVIHLIAGGVAGTTGAVLTCPLEVVKTRLQSSCTSVVQVNVQAALRLLPSQPQLSLGTSNTNCDVILNGEKPKARPNPGFASVTRLILQTEGLRGLFRGLGPTIVGVAPSRAIYFGAYASSKDFLNGVLTPDTHFVHLLSAVVAGVSATTLTNPIWFVKTRLQLDNKVASKKLTCRECVRNIYRENGVRGFYKGITASYFGVSETVMHLVIYEAIKAQLVKQKGKGPSNDKANGVIVGSASDGRAAKLTQMRVSEESGGGGLSSLSEKWNAWMTDYLKFMLSGACSKTFATCLCYPHEVARTRMREEGSKYNSFFQTIITVYKEEGRAGIYRGLGTQLMRQIPNTAIVMATYEAVVHALSPAD